MWGQFEVDLLSPTLVWSTPLGLPRRCDGHMHQHSTSDIRKRKRKRRCYSTCWHMALCEGVGWHLQWFALMTKFCDIREKNVTIRSEIWTTNIHSLEFRDSRECVTLWRFISRSLGCRSLEPCTQRAGHRARFRLLKVTPRIYQAVWVPMVFKRMHQTTRQGSSFRPAFAVNL